MRKIQPSLELEIYNQEIQFESSLALLSTDLAEKQEVLPYVHDVPKFFSLETMGTPEATGHVDKPQGHGQLLP